MSLRPVLISQRVDVIAGRNERRDALDQRWHNLLQACGLFAIAVPNRAAGLPDLVLATRPGGVILSGGNDIAAYGGDAPERDATEAALIGWAAAERKPLLAVCRGLQFLAHHFGAKLERLEGHAGTRHNVALRDGGTDDVNSYHDWGFRDAPRDFAVEATAPDSSIEAMRHDSLPLRGIMWHPEREAPFREKDVALIRRHFGTTS